MIELVLNSNEEEIFLPKQYIYFSDYLFKYIFLFVNIISNKFNNNVSIKLRSNDDHLFISSNGTLIIKDQYFIISNNFLRKYYLNIKSSFQVLF